jgi:hypothetical protein
MKRYSSSYWSSCVWLPWTRQMVSERLTCRVYQVATLEAERPDSRTPTPEPSPLRDAVMEEAAAPAYTGDDSRTAMCTLRTGRIWDSGGR